MKANLRYVGGVGLDNNRDTRTYKIRYRVLDAIGKYNDISELYWQFVGEDFEVSAAKITGTIKLPSRASSKEDIKVWGHVETLNGEIYATSEDTVEFNLTNFKSGRYVEVRVAFPTHLVEYSGRVYNEDKLSSIIEEETKWADEANAKRKRQQLMNKAIEIVGMVSSVFLGGLFFTKIKKYKEVLESVTPLHPSEEWEYFREIPSKTATPAEALFLYNDGVGCTSSNFGNVFSASLLDLSLKKYIKIDVDPNLSKKEQIKISILNSLADIKYDERNIYNFIRNAIGTKESITMKELQRYIKNHTIEVHNLIVSTDATTEMKTKDNGKYDVETAEKKQKHKGLYETYVGFAVLLIVFMFFVVLGFLSTYAFTKKLIIGLAVGMGIVIIPSIINGIINARIAKKYSRLSQEGIDEKQKWRALKKYMEEFSLLNEKEVPALEVWEEFLVYATVFGIADKVIKQLKIVYPEIENMDNFNTASYVYLMSHTDFNSSFSNAINSTISTAMSSGSGGGGGFSGGGGGGRRPEAAEAGR